MRKVTKEESNLIHKNYRRNRLIVFGIFIVAVFSMSIGFAMEINTKLRSYGFVTLSADDRYVEITSFTRSSSSNATINSSTGYTNNAESNNTTTLNTTYNITFRRSSGTSGTVVYSVLITNTSFKKQTLTSINKTSSGTGSTSNYTATVTGVNENSTILNPGESVTATVTLTKSSMSRNTSYAVVTNIDFVFNSTEEASQHNLLAVSNNTSSVKFNTFDSIVSASVDVINLTSSNVTFRFSIINNNNFIICYKENDNYICSDDDNYSLSNDIYTVSGGNISTFNYYIKIADEHIFSSTSDSFFVKLTTSNFSYA